jgi:hypothetical protein
VAERIVPDWHTPDGSGLVGRSRSGHPSCRAAI